MRCISKSWLALIFAITACTLCASSKSSNANELQGRQRVLHALNRLTFGARWPGLNEGQLYEGRDLAVTTDFREVLSEALYKHNGVRDIVSVFPNFESDRKRFLGYL